MFFKYNKHLCNIYYVIFSSHKLVTNKTTYQRITGQAPQLGVEQEGHALHAAVAAQRLVVGELGQRRGALAAGRGGRGPRAARGARGGRGGRGARGRGGLARRPGRGPGRLQVVRGAQRLVVVIRRELLDLRVTRRRFEVQIVQLGHEGR